MSRCLLLQDTDREVDKLCHFLDLSPTVEEKRQIISDAQFDNMKKNNMVNHSTISAMDFRISHFMRKGNLIMAPHVCDAERQNQRILFGCAGKVADWRNHFTVAQNEEFDDHYKIKMTDPALQFRTGL